MTRTNGLEVAATILGLGLLVAGCNDGSGHRPSAGWTPGGDGPRLTAAALQTPRAGHQATAIDDRRVLVTGGETLSERATDTFEVFDAETGFSQPSPNRMRWARAGHAAVRLETGRNAGLVLLVGGHDAQGEPLDSMELLDPTDGTNVILGRDLTLRAPRDGAAALAADGLLYLASGRGQRSLEVWSLADLRPLYVMDGLPGGSRTGAQLVRVDEGLLLLYGGQSPGGEEPPAVWLDVSRRKASVVEGEVVRGGAAVASPWASGEVLIVGGTIGEEGKPARRIQTLRRERATPTRAIPGGLTNKASGNQPTGSGASGGAAAPQGTPSRAAGAAATPTASRGGGQDASAVRQFRDVVGFLEVELRDPRVRRDRPAVLADLEDVYVFGGLDRGLPYAGAERLGPDGGEPLPPLHGPRTEPVVTALPGAWVVLSGGRGGEGRPTALVDVLTPAGVAGPDGQGGFAAADAAQAQRDALDADVAATRGERDLAQASADRLQGDVARTRDALAAARRRAQDLEAELLRARAAIQQAEARIASLEAEVQAARDRLAQLTAARANPQTLAAARDALTRLERELARTRDDLRASQDRVRQLSDELARLDATPTTSAAPPAAPAPGGGGGLKITFNGGPVRRFPGSR